MNSIKNDINIIIIVSYLFVLFYCIKYFQSISYDKIVKNKNKKTPEI